MTSYYNMHEGHLAPGDIAMAQDIIQCQQNTADMGANILKDLHEFESCIIGGEQDAFLLTPETKRANRYIDQMNLAEDTDSHFLSIREIDYRQPIKMSRSSLYSVIVKMQNLSEKDAPVIFELQDENEQVIQGKHVTLNLPKQTKPTEFEIVFDIDYYPTAHGNDPEDLENNETNRLIPREGEEDVEGVIYDNEENIASQSLGASTIYLVVKALNKNKFDINENDDTYIWNDDDPTFGICMNKNSNYGQLLEENTGSGYVQSSVPGDLYFKSIFSNSPSYKCQYGRALIDGEQVGLASTHVVVPGASAYGNVLSYIYMDKDGQLHAENSDVFTGTDVKVKVPEGAHLHIADIITYADDEKDPKIIQDDTKQYTRPRSHHERIRRLEKRVDYIQDIAMPPRFQYTLTGSTWIDEHPEKNLSSNRFNTGAADNIDALTKDGYNITTDANGNFIIKVTKAESFNIPITLKSTTSGVVKTVNKVKTLKSAQTSAFLNSLGADDISRAQTFAEIKNVDVDITHGTLKLSSNTADSNITVATNKKEAKETEFNPWDDSARNRPSSSKIKPITRAYTVTSGKNGKYDKASEYPAMTFYTKTNYNMKKLEIPIYKFKNCSGVKFIIYKRQDNNNQKNTVWLEKRMWTTGTFSLKKAKVKKGYQYMENGFLINFGKKGLTLPKGQYVIIALPIVSSGTGTMYVDTYAPSNPKDFCIRYQGAANASHFLLKDRYHEIWYNPVKATAEEITYDKKGSITSGIVTWNNKEPIASIKPTANFSLPSGTKAKVEVDTGGGWKELVLNKANAINGSKDSFRWRITLEGNKKASPVLKYDSSKKYALNFEITRATPQASNINTANTLDKNLCLTSVPINANNILRDYIGDMNFALNDNKFSNFEFARVWATDPSEHELNIDISGCDRIDEISSGVYYPVYSFHYVDLHLDDFVNSSIDYSNYDPDLEIDEHNLRFKLDTEHAYNDDDIQILNLSQFQDAGAAEVSYPNNTVKVDLSDISTQEQNQTLLKAKLDPRINFAQYDTIKIGLKVEGESSSTTTTENNTETTALSGLALYISSDNESTTPSNLKNKDEDDDITVLEDQLPDLNTSQEDQISKYANQIVKRYEPRNGTGGYVYYQSSWDSNTNQWIWEVVHTVKSYEIYEFINRTNKTNKLEASGDVSYYEIEIDPDKVNLQYAKEIGLILLNDESKTSIENITSVTMTYFGMTQSDYYAVFKASENMQFTKVTHEQDTVTKCYPSGSLVLGNNVKTTNPATSQIHIGCANIDSKGETIAVFDATSKSTKNYNHIGIQLAADCLLIKNMLELHLIQVETDPKTNVVTETVIDKVKLPSTNYIYYNTTGEAKINLIQVIKKLETSERFDKIALVATPKFKEYAKQLKTQANGQDWGFGNTIDLFIGNIILYQAETMPFFHPTMRMKFYFDDMTQLDRNNSGIRKIGVVIDYQ